MAMNAVVKPHKRRSSHAITFSNKLNTREEATGFEDTDRIINQVASVVHRIEEEESNEARRRIEEQSSSSLLLEVLDVSSTLEDGINAIVDDSFTRCFSKSTPETWNFNIYLFPLWLVGSVVRYFVLFPIRLIWLVSCFLIFFVFYLSVHAVLPKSKVKTAIEVKLYHIMCFVWASSWTAVIKRHGPKPVAQKNRVWVSNHTTMCDYLVISQVTPFAAVMQEHPGWLGVIQTYLLTAFGCVGFNRQEAKDRQVVVKKIRDHVKSDASLPLLIFPEGTCVNTRYTTMFKRGAFDLDAAVCPIAIKYNNVFVDPFWNSRQQSFAMHLVELMTSWCLVADIYFLEPQHRREGETPIEFAGRVQKIIAKKAGLKIVPWDGMLKYYSPSPKTREQKRELYGNMLRKELYSE